MLGLTASAMLRGYIRYVLYTSLRLRTGWTKLVVVIFLLMKNYLHTRLLYKEKNFHKDDFIYISHYFFFSLRVDLTYVLLLVIYLL
jgi:hypothetical protein